MNIWSWPSRLQTIIADLSPQPGNSSQIDLHVYLPIVLDRPQSKTWWLECWFMNLLHTIKIHMIRKSVHRNRTRVWFKTSRMSLEWPSKEDEWWWHHSSSRYLMKIPLSVKISTFSVFIALFTTYFILHHATIFHLIHMIQINLSFP